MILPNQQPSSAPGTAPDVVYVPEIPQPSSNNGGVDCPVEMPPLQNI